MEYVFLDTEIYMIRMNYKEIGQYEYNWYCEYMFPSCRRRVISLVKREPVRRIMQWQVFSRKTDYYYQKSHGDATTLIDKFLYLYYICLRNRMGEKLGLEIDTRNIGKGLVVYHYNNVVNVSAIIGENLHLHGCNVIGNAGNGDLRCPVIGNNVMMGAGAKVIGNVTIADNIKIAAGAVVVTSFTEPGITIGGIPARRLK